VSAATRLRRLGLLLLALVLAGAAYLYFRLEYPGKPETPSQATILFAPGTATAEIFRRLEQAGVVRDARVAEIYYRIYRGRTPLQAGEYRFDRPTPIDDIINRMGRGDVVRYSIVVPDGLTADETFQLFWSRGIGGPDGFRRAIQETELLPGMTTGVSDLEGYLFPDTYLVTRSTSARAVVDLMVAQFKKNFTPEMREKASRLGLTVEQAVALASIVEKESGVKSEGPTISSVYLNRLKRGMRLQADPTVICALKRDGKWSGTLYRSDYNYDSPYNTYMYDGLPPGPICNPGLTALQAAVSPAKTDFLYFVADASGGHRFSRTFEEHLIAIAAVKRQRAAQETATDEN
jgi:peptidoglycan lytic transglycosylase G